MNTRVFRVSSGLLLVAPLVLGGCKPGASTSNPDDRSVVAGESDGAEAKPPSGAPVVFASKGVPHGSAITLIALDPGGEAALSRDTGGSVRLWPALDGSREPLVVPIRDPRAMALGSDGAGGWVLALLDAAGGARLVGVDPGGNMTPLASLPPTDPLADIVVLPGAQQLVAVGSDHVIRLLDRKGTELARLDTPGLRPASLRIATDTEGGPRIVAVTAGEFDSKEGRFAVELLTLEHGSDRLAFTPTRQTIHLDSPPSTDNPTLTPDGRTAVYLQRQRLGAATWKLVATQLEDGRSVSVDTQIAVGQQPRFGLLANGRVLLDDGTGLGRVVDLRERHVELTGLRSSPTINHLATSFAAGKRVAPASNWLAVHELESDDLRYLGYEQITVTDAGISPAGRTVAWALNDRVAVELLESNESNEVFEIPGSRAQPQRFVEFLDEELLVTLDWAGGIKLVRWRDGELVSAADLGNHVQTAELARDDRGNGVLFVRTNLWQNPTVVELREGEIGGRYLAHSTANLTGIFAPADAPFDDWGAWALDGTATLRTYGLTQLREGIDTGSALAGGEVLSFGMPEQFTVDSSDGQIWIRTSGANRPTLHVERGTVSEEVELAPGFVVMLVPSRDARRIAVVQQRDLNQLVTVLDSATLQPLWARPIPATSALSWSDDGDRLVVPASLGGGVVFDGDDGVAVTARCGLEFEVRRAPPVGQAFSDQLSVCDL